MRHFAPITDTGFGLHVPEGVEGKPYLASIHFAQAVFCDAASTRGEAGFPWQAQPYSSSTVALHRDGTGRRSPVERSVRPR